MPYNQWWLRVWRNMVDVLVLPYIFSRTVPFTLDILDFTCTLARQKDFENILTKDSNALKTKQNTN